MFKEMTMEARKCVTCGKVDAPKRGCGACVDEYRACQNNECDPGYCDYHIHIMTKEEGIS
jgi:hypothetical protein